MVLVSPHCFLKASGENIAITHPQHLLDGSMRHDKIKVLRATAKEKCALMNPGRCYKKRRGKKGKEIYEKSGPCAQGNGFED